MPIRAKCPSCERNIRVNDKLAGKRVRCPNPECRSPVTIPRPGSEDDDLDWDALGQMERTGLAQERSPAQEQRPAKKPSVRPQPSGSWLPIVAVAGGVLAIAVLGFVALRFVELPSFDSSGRSISREQKVFHSGSDLGWSGTTSEWFEKIKEMKTTENPMRHTMMRAKLRNPKQALGPDRAALPVVFDALTDRDLKRYAEAILNKFNQLADPPYFQDVKDALDHPDEEVRRWGAKMLVHVRVEDDQTITELAEYLGKPEVSGYAALALGHMGPEAMPHLHEAVKQADGVPAISLLRGLQSQGAAAAPAVPDLAKWLDDEEAGTRAAVLETLAAIGPAAKEAASALAHRLGKETNGDVKSLLIDALVSLGPISVEHVTKKFDDDSTAVKIEALAVLAALGEQAHSAVDQVAGLLQVQEDSVRDAALDALDAFGSRAGPAKSSVLELLSQGEGQFKQQASAILISIREQADFSVDDLIVCVSGGDRPLRLAAIRRLQECGPEARQAIPALRTAYQRAVARKQQLQRDLALLDQSVVLVFEDKFGGKRELTYAPPTREQLASGKPFLTEGEFIQRQNIVAGLRGPVERKKPDRSEAEQAQADNAREIAALEKALKSAEAMAAEQNQQS